MSQEDNKVYIDSKIKSPDKKRQLSDEDNSHNKKQLKEGVGESSSFAESSSDLESSTGGEDSSSEMIESSDSITVYPGSNSSCSGLPKDVPSAESIFSSMHNGPVPNVVRGGISNTGHEMKPLLTYFDTQETLQLAEDCRPHYCNARLFPLVCKVSHALPIRGSRDGNASQGEKSSTNGPHELSQAFSFDKAKSPSKAKDDINNFEVDQSLTIVDVFPEREPIVDISANILSGMFLAPRLEDALSMRFLLLEQQKRKADQVMKNSGFVLELLLMDKS